MADNNVYNVYNTIEFNNTCFIGVLIHTLSNFQQIQMLFRVILLLLLTRNTDTCPEGVPGWILAGPETCYHESTTSMSWFESQEVKYLRFKDSF